MLAADGHSYEREAIRAWLVDHDTSPVTGEPLAHRQLVQNWTLQSLLSATAGELIGNH